MQHSRDLRSSLHFEHAAPLRESTSSWWDFVSMLGGRTWVQTTASETAFSDAAMIVLFSIASQLYRIVSGRLIRLGFLLRLPLLYHGTPPWD